MQHFQTHIERKYVQEGYRVRNLAKNMRRVLRNRGSNRPIHGSRFTAVQAM